MTMLDSIARYFKQEKLKNELTALTLLKGRYHAFRIFLENNGQALELLVKIDGLLAGDPDARLRQAVEQLMGVCCELVDGLNLLADDRYAALYSVQGMQAKSVLQQLQVLEKTQNRPTPFSVALEHPDAIDPSLFGNKGATLARLKRLGLPVPDGFVCSIYCCKHFLSEGGLTDKIRELLNKVDLNVDEMDAVATEIQQMIMSTPIPPALQESLKRSYTELQQRLGMSGSPQAVSVRSSGVSEDTKELSFAGQFVTVLNVKNFEQIQKAYREVLAGGFSARAISYRKNAGLPIVDFELAVLCQVMLAPYCAGVLFTHDPAQPENGRMVISAVPGLGIAAVDGSSPADIYRPPRLKATSLPNTDTGLEQVAPIPEMLLDPEQLLSEATIAHKTTQQVNADNGGLTEMEIPPEQRDLPLLAPETIAELMRLGLLVESQANSPQDIEWACSESGSISILQARPLRLSVREGARLQLPLVSAPLVTGTCACSGRAVGQVLTIKSATDLYQARERLAEKNSESPAILILPQSIIDAAPLIKHCAGVIIDIGNPTDHLSCVAREHNVPMITGAENALSCLRDEQWIILDGDQGMIFSAPESVRAMAAELAAEKAAVQHTRTKQPAYLGSSPERQQLMEMIVPLHLTNDFGPTFNFQDCQSVHDLIRYTHEMAVLSMFDAGDQIMDMAGNLLRPLELGIPFSFLVIDLGGGLRQPSSKRTLSQRLSPRKPVGKEEILSMPLGAFCEGLTDPQLSWHSAPDSEALSGLMSRTMLDSRGKRPVGSFNYALTARDYLNLNVRMEYHFAMLDSVCGRDAHANYIRFRFKGGGASQERSNRRALFLQRVLQRKGFYTSVVGDLITASLTGASKDAVAERLVIMGQLFGFSRFLDGVMTDDETPYLLADQFLAGNLAVRTSIGAGEERQFQA
jgi:pyruvate,water dikinase